MLLPVLFTLAIDVSGLFSSVFPHCEFIRRKICANSSYSGSFGNCSTLLTFECSSWGIVSISSLLSHELLALNGSQALWIDFFTGEGLISMHPMTLKVPSFVLFPGYCLHFLFQLKQLHFPPPQMNENVHRKLSIDDFRRAALFVSFGRFTCFDSTNTFSLLPCDHSLSVSV